jgi:hypothetical protein
MRVGEIVSIRTSMSRFARVGRFLGIEPWFLVVLASGVPLALATVVATSDASPAAARPSEPAPVLSVRPPIETYYLLPIRVSHGHAAGGVQRLEVGQGDKVSIGVLSDQTTVVSVPGYEVWAPLEAGREGVIDLVALDWGRFPVKADGKLVGVLSVRPSWAGPPQTGS